MTTRCAWVAVVAVAFGSGCGNDDGGPIGTGCRIDANFDSIHSNLLSQQTCARSGCHGGSMPAAGLAFDQSPGDVYDALYVMTSTGASPLLLVDPGDFEQSYFWQKVGIDDPGGPFGRMPPGGAIAQCEVDAIAEWITDGARFD